jgi:hypothetical protein
VDSLFENYTMTEAEKSSELPLHGDGESGTRHGRANGQSSPAEKGSGGLLALKNNAPG